jgi:hypothetical protein
MVADQGLHQLCPKEVFASDCREAFLAGLSVDWCSACLGGPKTCKK